MFCSKIAGLRYLSFSVYIAIIYHLIYYVVVASKKRYTLNLRLLL